MRVISKLPRWIFAPSAVPGRVGRLFGRSFSGWTFGPFIFLREAEMRVLVHESRHVDQFYVGWLAGLVLWLAFSRSLWWLLVTPFTFLVAYGLASLYARILGGDSYRDNAFEADARRKAGEPP